MKNKDELELIASQIINSWMLDDDSRIIAGRHDTHKLRALIAEALSKVQDEAEEQTLDLIMPSDQEVADILFQLSPRQREACLSFYKWLIDNMKPAPKPLERMSDEELEKLALKYVQEKDWIHNKNRRALGEAIMMGYRAAEDRLLGKEKK